MADDELIGINLSWRGMTKRLWLAVPSGPAGRKALGESLKALETEGDRAGTWLEFLDLAVDLFKKHGIRWVDN